MGITHSTVVVVPDDPAFPVGTDEWNDAHVIAAATITAAQLAPDASALTVFDEGTPLDTAVSSFDFTGPGVTASVVGHAVTVDIASGTAGTPITDTFTGDGAQTTFTLSHTATGSWGIAAVNGAQLLPSEFAISGTSVVFDVAPALAAEVAVTYVWGGGLGGGLTVEGDTGSVSGVTTLQVEGAGGASVAVTEPVAGTALATVTASGGGGGGGATYTAYTFTAADNDPGLGGGLLTTVPAGTLVLGMYGLVTESFDNSTTGLFLSVGDYANGDAMNYDPEIGPDPAPTNDGGNVTQWQFMPCSLPNTSGQIQVGRAGANPTGVWVACSGSGAPNNGSMDIILVTVP